MRYVEGANKLDSEVWSGVNKVDGEVLVNKVDTKFAGMVNKVDWGMGVGQGICRGTGGWGGQGRWWFEAGRGNRQGLLKILIQKCLSSIPI